MFPFAKVFLLSIAFISSLFGKRDAPKDNFSLPDGISYEVLQYREGDHERAGQIGIAYKTKKTSDKKLPIVVFIHGGGWSKGDKDGMRYQAIRYAQRGYLAATISYRLISEAPLPSCILDVKQAIRFLKKSATKFNGDPERIGVQGYSAGAHLALLIGLTPEIDKFKSSAYNEFDSTVQCVFAVAGPTDFSTRLEKRGKLKFLTEEQNNNPLFLKEISPLSYINKGQIPIFIMHGDKDSLVPAYNYQLFNKKCQEMGVANFELHEFKEGGHMFFFKHSKKTLPIMDSFFDKSLK